MNKVKRVQILIDGIMYSDFFTTELTDTIEVNRITGLKTITLKFF